MIDYINSGLYNQDGVYKQIEIHFDDEVITNSELHYEKFELDESLCSEMQLKFGCCEAAKLSFRIVNPYDAMKGKSITVYNILNKDTANPFQIGKYKVYSDVPSADRKYRDITAYDAMYDIINADVTEWYDSMFPDEDSTVTLKEFRNAFISHFELEEEEIDLVNDSMLISKTISGTGITGKMVISAICEINGCFGNIGRNGKFRYVYLVEKSPEIYPSNDLYPSDDLFPLGTNAIEFSRRRYKGSPTYEDFKVQKISKLQIRMEENDIGVVVGDGDNTYVIQDNFLVYGMSTEELTPIANNILDAIKVVEYRPCTVTAIGNPCVEVGDFIRINTKTINIDTYVLKRVLGGIQVLTDSYTATGEEFYSEIENGTLAEIRRLKGKSNVLERTIEETKLLITDEETGLQSQVTQNAKEIKLRVSEKDITGNYIIAKINLDSTTAKITAKNIVLEGLVTANSNFKILEDGSIEAVNATLNGSLISHSDSSTCYMHDGELRLYPEVVTEPESYEGDDFSSLSHNRFIMNGSAYINELKVGPYGHKPMLSELTNGFYGLVDSGGSDSNWIRTTSNGLIPYQSGGSGSIGTSGWEFNNGHFKNIHLSAMNFGDYGTGILWNTTFGQAGIYSLSTGAGLYLMTISSEVTGGWASALLLADSSGINLVPKSGGTFTGNLGVDGTLTVGNQLLVNNAKIQSEATYESTTSASANLVISSQAWLNRSTASSRRYKHDIIDLQGELSSEKLLSVPIRQYKFNNDYISKDDQRYNVDVPGFIAEELYEHYPIAVEIIDGQIEDWNHRMIIPPMLDLIQKLHRRIAELERRMEA